MTFSLQAGVVFPVDRPPIEHGVVTIEGERIVAVGKNAEGGEVIDLGSVALLPGLVNAHTHLEFSYLPQPLGKPGMPLVDWIRLVIAERGRGNRSTSDSLLCGLHESIGCGVTTIADIATSVPGCLFGWDVTVFAEVIGFSRARADSALRSLIERLDFVEQALGEWKGCENVLPQFGISPHAPYTVSPELLQRLVELARKRGLGVAMHVAESRDELELLDGGSGPFRELLEERSMWDAGAIPRGNRPMNYLRLLAQAPRALVIHGNYLDQEEFEFLRANRDRMSLVYCPRTHAYFHHRRFPLSEALSLGVRIALGTDSRASNPDLNLLAEMRYVARAYPGIDPQDVLRIGTLGGAEALGRDRDVGSIAPGKFANLIAVPLQDDIRANTSELLAAVIAESVPPSSIWLRGTRTPGLF